MARIAGVNIPNHQHTVIGLTAIFGIGKTQALKICDSAGVAIDKKVKDLTDAELEKLRDEVGKRTTEGDLRREVTMNIKRLMDLACYRGIRHRKGFKEMHYLGRLQAVKGSKDHASPLLLQLRLPPRWLVRQRSSAVLKI